MPSARTRDPHARPWRCAVVRDERDVRATQRYADTMQRCRGRRERRRQRMSKFMEGLREEKGEDKQWRIR